MHGYRSPWRDGHGLALALLVALGARWLLLSDWLGYDECQIYLVAKSPLWRGFLEEFRVRDHPPLAYLLIKPFAIGGSAAGWLRLPSLLAGLGAVVLIHAILRRLHGASPASWLGTLALGLLPVFVQQSVELRGYSLCLLFVWWNWWVVVDAGERGFERPADHARLALPLGLAVFTEYSAIFHVAALLPLVYGPRLARWRARRAWRPALAAAACHGTYLAAAAALFRWQFAGHVPEPQHVTPALYAGSLLGPRTLLAFLAERLPRQLGALLPGPAAWAVLACLLRGVLVPSHGEPGEQRPPRLTRFCAAYGLAVLGLLFAAALLRLYPFGGAPRHAAVVMPGLALGAWLGAVAAVRGLPLAPRARALTAGALAVALAAMLAAALRPPVRPDRAQLAAEVELDRYREAPAPIVVNRPARSLLSWWLLPEPVPQRRLRELTRIGVFDYGGIPVAEPTADQEILDTALFYAQHFDASWIWLAYPADAPQAAATHAFLEESLRRTSGIRLEVSRRAPFVRDSVILKISRTGDAG